MPLLLEADGADPVYAPLATSRGRVGHLTALQLDGITRRFGVQMRNRESIGDWVFDLVDEVNETSHKHGKAGIWVLKKNRRRPVVLLGLDDFLTILTKETCNS